MDLRELKKEAYALPNIEKEARSFQESWIKPLRTNTNSHLPFIKSIDQETRLQLNKRLAYFHKTIDEIKQGQMINERLQDFSRYLVEMKLTQIQGDSLKTKVLARRMIEDDFFSLRQTISDIKEFEGKMLRMKKEYHEINDILHKNLSLDETLFFMNLPHGSHLNGMWRTSQKQKKIIKELGKHFVSLVKSGN